MFPSEYKYTKAHEWIEFRGDRCKIGITDHAQRELGEVVYVELPDVGATIKQGQSFVVIEAPEAILELYSSVAGEVTEVNVALKRTPGLLNSNPHRSWIISVKLNDTDNPPVLLDAMEYATFVRKPDVDG
jgi:glycine cleavage system H protein